MSEPRQAEPNAFEKSLPAALLLMTGVTGLVDAVSFLSLGRVFTANMTGNVVFLAFALTGVSQLSAPRSLTAIAAFMLGAVVGGRLMNSGGASRSARPALTVFAIEVALLGASAVAAIGVGDSASVDPRQVYALIVLTAVAMGARNASVRKLAVPDLTTTVLTLTITGLAADSTLARGEAPRWRRRVGSIVAMLLGAAVGALLVRRSVALTLGLAASASAAAAAMLWRTRAASPADNG